MKKKILLVLFLLVLCGCSIYNTPPNIVKNFLSKYNKLDEEVLMDMEIAIIDEQLSDENKELYKSVLKRQYENIEYEIIDEVKEKDKSTVKVEFNVYDYTKAINNSYDYMINNREEFTDENGIFNNDLYTEYKLNNMKNIEDRIPYEVTFNLEKKNDTWILTNPSRETLEKIHGIYGRKD